MAQVGRFGKAAEHVWSNTDVPSVRLIYGCERGRETQPRHLQRVQQVCPLRGRDRRLCACRVGNRWRAGRDRLPALCPTSGSAAICRRPAAPRLLEPAH